MTGKEVLLEAQDLAVRMNEETIEAGHHHVVVLLALRMFEKSLTESTRSSCPESLEAVEKLWDAFEPELAKTLKECGHVGAD